MREDKEKNITVYNVNDITKTARRQNGGLFFLDLGDYHFVFF